MTYWERYFGTPELAALTITEIEHRMNDIWSSALCAYRAETELLFEGRLYPAPENTFGWVLDNHGAEGMELLEWFNKNSEVEE